MRAAALAERASAEGELFDVMFRRDELDDTQRRLAAEIEATTTNLRRVAVEAFIIGGEVGTLEYLAAFRTRAISRGAGTWCALMLGRHGWPWTGFARCESRLTARCSRASPSPRHSVSRPPCSKPSWRSSTTATPPSTRSCRSPRRGIERPSPLRRCLGHRAERQVGTTSLLRVDPQLRGDLSERQVPRRLPVRLPDLADRRRHRRSGGGPPEEQDARARELYARRGPQPWPECGRFLE